MGNDFKEIKRRIYEEEKVEELLKSMGCSYISYEQNGSLITAQLPDKFNSSNKRSVQVRINEELLSYVRSRGFAGDIFGLISYIVHGCEAKETIDRDRYYAKKYICDTLGYHEYLNSSYFTDFEDEQKPDYLWFLKDIKKQREKKDKIENIKENEYYNENIKNQFIMLPNKWWLDEGISLKTQKEFEVGFDLKSERIITIIRNGKGNIIGVKGRYVGGNKDILEHVKYVYLYPMNKSIELYNLHKALPYIQKRKEVLVYEGYKSVMKSWQYGAKHAVSIEGDNISPVQVKLLKDLGLDVRIILCFDKDKDQKFIIEQAKKFGTRQIYCLFDKENLLKKKDSPVDQGRKIFIKLYRKKYKVPLTSSQK